VARGIPVATGPLEFLHSMPLSLSLISFWCSSFQYSIFNTQNIICITHIQSSCGIIITISLINCQICFIGFFCLFSQYEIPLIMFLSWRSKHGYSLWSYTISISSTILRAIFSTFSLPNKLLAYHNNF